MRKIYYYVQLKTLSPLNIGNGKSELTDMDVLKDENGRFFIPGSSIAGVCCHDLNEEEKALFHPVLDDQNKQCPIFFSDAYMMKSNNVKYEVRDGIQVRYDEKVSVDGSKYNYEIVPRDTSFVLRIEVTDRDDNKEYEDLVERLLTHIKNQDIKFGAKTTRGLGSITVVKCGKRVFDKTNFEKEYFKFNCEKEEHYRPHKVESIVSKKYVVMKVVLQQVGGISIRTYNTIKEEADYEHIYSKGNPVIPGSSWNGLIRHAFKKYADLLDMPELTNEFFGNVDTKEQVKEKSKVYFEESILVDGESKEMFRNSINRFHGKTMNTGLFREKSYFDGKTTLTIRIDKTVNHLDVVVNILKAIIEDINDGFLALGGLTAIGRGIFKCIEPLSITGLEDIDDEK